MAYLLDGQEIRRPVGIKESNSTITANQRTLSGSYRRDIFGSNKRIWELDYDITKKTDYDIINAIYQSYLNTNSTKSWQITEANYTVSSVNVHVDLLVREFGIKGSDYLSSFTLVLTEA